MESRQRFRAVCPICGNDCYSLIRKSADFNVEESKFLEEKISPKRVPYLKVDLNDYLHFWRCTD